MATITSSYLDCNFDVQTYDSGEAIIISHDALEDIIHNQVPKDYGVRYEFSDLLISDQHSVLRCTITDEKGRRIQAIGEVVPATLETEIARNYPVLMASQRAFDRAAIRYLGIAGKVYSNTEGVSSGPEGAEDAAANGGTSAIDVDATLAEEAEQIPVEEEPAYEPPAQPVRSAPPAQQPRAQQPQQRRSTPAKPASAPAPAPAPTANTALAGDVILDLGRYHNANKSIAMVYAEDPSYVKWIADTFNARDEKAFGIKQACGAYLAQMTTEAPPAQPARSTATPAQQAGAPQPRQQQVQPRNAATPSRSAQSNPANGAQRPARPAPATPAPTPAANTASAGDVILDLGRYRNANKAIATVYAEDSSYVKWIADTFGARDEKSSKIKQACSAFLAEIGG